MSPWTQAEDAILWEHPSALASQCMTLLRRAGFVRLKEEVIARRIKKDMCARIAQLSRPVNPSPLPYVEVSR